MGSPEERFREDPLRMMRAVRFMSQLVFSLSEDTQQQIHLLSDYLAYISIERIRSEFDKLLCGEAPTTALSVLKTTGLCQSLPGLEVLKDVSAYDMTRLTHRAERWAFMGYICAVGDIKPWLKKWKHANQTISAVLRIHEGLTRCDFHEWSRVGVYHFGKETAISIERVKSVLHGSDLEAVTQHITTLSQQLPITDRSDLAVSGHDLLAWSERRQGPWLAEVLTAIEQAVIRGELVNQREAIQQWFNQQKQPF